jgi:hypothetical protein
LDEADRAAMEEARFQQEAQFRATHPHTVRLLPKGQCFWCDEPVSLPKLFCDAECSQHWQHAEERKGK